MPSGIEPMSVALREPSVEPWRSHEEPPLSRESLRALFANEIPAIRMRGFASPEECAGFARAIGEIGMQHVYRFADADDHPLSDYQTGYIGLTHYNYRHKPKAEYLAEVPEACAFRDRVFARSFDALARMVGALAAVTDGEVSVAKEPDGSLLYAGIIRNASGGGALHADFAPFTAPGFVVGQIEAQISWNLWVEHPERGGKTTVHHRPWTPDTHAAAIPENYPLERGLVEGAERHTYVPRVGDAILFNTRNPHEITPGEAGDRARLQVGSFVGRLPSGDLLLWS